MRGGDAAEGERAFGREAFHRAVKFADEADGFVFRSLQQAGDQAVMRAGDVGEAFERAFLRPFQRDVGGVRRAGPGREGEARKARAVARAGDGAAEGVARFDAEDGLVEAEGLHVEFVEADADVGTGAAGFLRGDLGRAKHIDDTHADLADFQLANEEAGGGPFDAHIAGAQPHAVIVYQRNVGDSGGVERIALEAGDADRAEGTELAAVDLRGDEGAAAIAGDPEAQRHGGGEQHEDQPHQPEADAEPERRLLLRFLRLDVFHQKACPMEI